MQDEELPPSDLMQVRRQKLDRLRQRGLDPYPHSFERTHTSRQARELLLAAEGGEPGSDGDARTDSVSVAGRMVAVRGMGRAAFVDIM
ncbi:MAG: lysine--tRNA ligase, partial [Dehalococcoidia bacterium]|nr:lysine--tRNA ligase [Dehalococcoidia bacterium]